MDHVDLSRQAAPVTPAASDAFAHRCRIRDAAGGLISPQWCLTQFAETLINLAPDLAEEDVLRPELRVYADGSGLEVFYTPFELVYPDARVILVGVTPGRHQQYLAIREAATALRSGATAVEALERASRVGSFAGPLRTNLAAMLNGIGLNRALDVRNCAVLFDEPLGAVASTSRSPTPRWSTARTTPGTLRGSTGHRSCGRSSRRFSPANSPLRRMLSSFR